jgi:hypothetical protein
MEEKPTVFTSWNSWYWLVLAVMAFQVVLFYFLTQSFQ